MRSKGTSEKPGFFEKFESTALAETTHASLDENEYERSESLGRSVCEQVSVLRSMCSRANWSDRQNYRKRWFFKDGFSGVPKDESQEK